MMFKAAGGLMYRRGKIARMKTGKVETLVSTLPAYLNSLSGKGVHMKTNGKRLSCKKGLQWMGKVFNYLGVSTEFALMI